MRGDSDNGEGSRGSRSRSRRWSPRGKEGTRPAVPEEKGHRHQDSNDQGAGAHSRADGAGGATASTRSKQSHSSSRRSSGSSSGSNSNTDQDEIIHFDWKPGVVMNERYKLMKFLGDGTFGRCVLAHDAAAGRQVAIKIIRDVKRYAENAKIEADILNDIRKADRNSASGCSIMLDTFDHGPHYCLVFEPLGVSLYDFLKSNHFRGFLMEDVQAFARQSMQALAFLHETLQLTHTDLKPENILLVSAVDPVQQAFPREAEWVRRRISHGLQKDPGPYLRPATNAIKIIDFGNATYADEHHSSIINTRQYRGPEVLLSLGWGEKSDLWSIGAILMELYTGEQLFETHEEMEHLALVSRVIGELPDELLDAAPPAVRDRYLVRTSSGRLRLPWPERASSASSERHVYSQRPLADQVEPHHRAFADFLGKILRLDPKTRPSAHRWRQHDFFGVAYTD